MILMIGASVVVLVIMFFTKEFFGGMIGLYRIIPPNEAHIRVLMNKKNIYSHREGGISAYWIIPFITKVNRLPLCNLTIPVNDIKLNDKNMAKFTCDVVCFINIKDLELASERLLLSDAERQMGFDFVKLSDDFRTILESIARTVVTKQTILEVYMNRQALSIAITHDIESVFPKWGIELVNLELKHIKDIENSTIISDIERKVAAEIKRDAEIKVAQTEKETQVAQAEAKEASQKRQIEQTKVVGIAEQEKNLLVAKQEAEANFQKIEARRKLEVGQAEIEKQKVEQAALASKIKLITEAQGKSEAIQREAEGEANAIKAKGKAQADVVLLNGEAEAEVIRKKKLAEAEGTEKLAEALAKFNDAGLKVKMLEIQKDIQISRFNAMGTAISNADIKWIISGENAKEFFGLRLDAESGANLEQFFQQSGLAEKGKEIVDKLLPKKPTN